MEDKLYITGLCPYCSLPLDYEPEDSAVLCPVCSKAIPTSALKLPGIDASFSSEQEENLHIAEGLTSAEAGLIYMDNFCENFDWAAFAETDKLSIPLLDTIAATAKIKFSDDPLTYMLDFRRLALPVFKKIEGLEVLRVDLALRYKSDDMSDMFEIFDVYSTVTKAIVASREQIKKELLSAIRAAKKFDISEEDCADLERSFELFERLADAVIAAESIDDIEVYRTLRHAKDAALISRLRESGIDAKKTYEKALSLISEGKLDAALHLLLIIRGYADSEHLLAAHTRIFSFGEEFSEMAGRQYVIRKKLSYFNPAEPEKYSADSLSLYEIRGGELATPAVISQISRIIGVFGTKIFFIRNSSRLCCFDTSSGELYANVRVLDEAPVGDYAIDDGYMAPLFSSDGGKFFIRKKLREPERRRGCCGSRKSVSINRQNNYSVLMVDMDKVSAEVVIPEAVDVMDFFGDRIFYTVLSAKDGSSAFRVYDVTTGEHSDILDSNSVIHNVIDGVIIYSTYAPNSDNMNLYTIDFERREPILIAKNIRDYYTSYGDRIFYTVGNESYNRLYSSRLDGCERREILENVKRICTVRSGYIYYVSGTGRNSCLMKVSYDGERNIRVAPRFSHMLRISGGYLYYASTSGELCIVRCDGHGMRVIADKVDTSSIIIDDKKIYCLREDDVRDREGLGDGAIYSLYSTDLEGKNLKKLAYGVTEVKEYNEKNLYICTKKSESYLITTPIGKKKSSTDTVVCPVTEYATLDKDTEEITPIVTLGVPERTFTTYRSGCLFFRKTKRRDGTVTLMPRVISYKRRGVTDEGTVLREELAEKAEEESRRKGKKQDKKLANKAKRQSKKDRKHGRREEKLKKRELSKARHKKDKSKNTEQKEGA